jgi:hypothetical protein
MKIHKDDHATQPVREKIELTLPYLTHVELTNLFVEEVNAPGYIFDYIYNHFASRFPEWKEHGWSVVASSGYEGYIGLIARREP